MFFWGKVKLLLAVLLISSSSQLVEAQGRHSVYFEAGKYNSVYSIGPTYDFMIVQPKSGRISSLFLSVNLGLRYGERQGNDIVEIQRLGNFGFNTGLSLFQNHIIEVGIQQHLIAEKEGYLSITEDDSWEYSNSARGFIGYRFNYKRFLFRTFAYLDRRKEIRFSSQRYEQYEYKRFFWPAIGFGINF